MVKLLMPRGSDECAFGGTRFPVSNIDWTCEVSPEAAAVLLRTGSGAVLAEPAVIEEPEGEAVMVHADPEARFAFRGTVYASDGGRIRLPLSAVIPALSHGLAGPLVEGR